MQNQPLVSVLIALYNAENYIRDAIESVIKSSYTSWELIIVDDCSTDKSYEIAKAFELSDSRIKVFKNPRNMGDYPNRNEVASKANGKYLKYLDCDDMLTEDCISQMVKDMERHSEAALCFSLNTPFPKYTSQVLDSNLSYVKCFNGDNIFNIGPTGALIRTSVFKEMNGFVEERYVGDFQFWLRVAAKYSIVITRPNLVFWRIHPNQESNNANSTTNLFIVKFKIVMTAIWSQSSPLSIRHRVKFTYFQSKILFMNALKSRKISLLFLAIVSLSSPFFNRGLKQGKLNLHY